MERSLQEQRLADVWSQLDGVTDPELDEPVTELNFVSGVEVDAQDRVSIEFRLPTYWCAANFSFLMADDMRSAVGALPWVKAVTVHLGEHMYADKINAGLAEGRSFQDTFGAEADGDLDDLRRIFLIKAFQRRQAALLGFLSADGRHADWIVALTNRELETLAVADEGRRLIGRYGERRAIVGPARAHDLAFVDTEGAPLQAETLSAYTRALRRVGVNAEFNSALCKGLLAVRFDTETPFVRPHPSVAAGDSKR